MPIWLTAFIIFAITAADDNSFSTQEKDLPHVEPLARMGWGNDLFSGTRTHDDGFTNDLELDFGLDIGQQRWVLESHHSMVTEFFGHLRTDDVTFVLSDQVQLLLNKFLFTFRPHVGLALTGNFGGEKLQTWVHRLTGHGRTPKTGLQTQYVDDGQRKSALTPGGAITVEYAFNRFFETRANVDTQIAIGPTGVYWFIASIGAGMQLPYWWIRPVFEVDLVVGRFFTIDPGLRIHGGYETKHFQFMPQIRIALMTKNFSFGWEQQFNEGGAGQANGIFFLEWQYHRIFE